MNQKLLSVAKGEAPADLVIRNGKIVNVYSGEIYDGCVAVCGDTIAAVGDVDYCIGARHNWHYDRPARGWCCVRSGGH